METALEKMNCLSALVMIYKHFTECNWILLASAEMSDTNYLINTSLVKLASQWCPEAPLKTKAGKKCWFLHLSVERSSLKKSGDPYGQISIFSFPLHENIISTFTGSLRPNILVFSYLPLYKDSNTKLLS